MREVVVQINSFTEIQLLNIKEKLTEQELNELLENAVKVAIDIKFKDIYGKKE